jgi:hypothetical protein
MGLSFHDNQSMMDAVGSLRFNASDNESSEMGTISLVHQHSRGDDEIGIDRSNDIDTVER